MKAPLKYAGTAALVVAVLTAGLWPFLDVPERRAVLIAGAVALPTQILAFWLLVSFRSRLNAFMAVWLGGTAFRMLIVCGVAFVAIRSGVDGGVALLLALAGFFFALLLLEPMYFGLPTRERRS